MDNAPEHAALASGDVTGSEETLVAPARSRSGSNSRALKVAGLTTLACLLVSSQVFALYTLFDHKNQISMMKKDSAQLSRQLNRPAPAVAPGKMQLPMNSELLLSEFDSDGLMTTKTRPTTSTTRSTSTRPTTRTSKTARTPKASMTVLQDTVPSLEQQVKDLQQVLQDTVSRLEQQVKDLQLDSQLPPFNETILAPLLSLKSQMKETEWQRFESWMRHWLIMEMAKPAPQLTTTASELE
ncbi:uncharacterized protein [Brachionichthys hirsutus]|uniref:uncharacterized protein n=1 Tax=Brachionichthys hirsutus TaxID=412623 RepID=UPI003604B813